MAKCDWNLGVCVCESAREKKAIHIDEATRNPLEDLWCKVSCRAEYCCNIVHWLLVVWLLHRESPSSYCRICRERRVHLAVDVVVFFSYYISYLLSHFSFVSNRVSNTFAHPDDCRGRSVAQRYTNAADRYVTNHLAVLCVCVCDGNCRASEMINSTRIILLETHTYGIIMYWWRFIVIWLIALSI